MSCRQLLILSSLVEKFLLNKNPRKNFHFSYFDCLQESQPVSVPDPVPSARQDRMFGLFSSLVRRVRSQQSALCAVQKPPIEANL